MWAAIRYRRAQALVLVLLSALIATCAVVAPLYQRALEQAQLRQAVGEASAVDTALTVRAGRNPANPDFGSRDLEGNVQPGLKRLYSGGIGQVSQPFDIIPRKGLKPSPVTILSRDGSCEHLRLTVGRCPAAADEILVSAKDLAAWKWPLGKVFEPAIPGSEAVGQLAFARLVVVGAYEVVPDAGYWLTEQLDGKSGTLLSIGQDLIPAVDDFVTTEETFDPRWRTAQASLTLPLNRDLFTLDNLDEVQRILADRTTSTGGVPGALVTTQLPELIDGLRVGQSRL